MTLALTSAPPVRTSETLHRPRQVIYRTRGHAQGGITRLMSPGDIGELVKPFVFLDHFEFAASDGHMLPMHPHSGIATHTTLLDGALEYADSTGKSGRLPSSSVEWMRAGGGVWHTGRPVAGQPVRGFQLWVALPASLENAPAESHYVDAATIPSDGPVRLLLGTFGGMSSPIRYPGSVTYLHVRLRDGERWTYQPAAGHDVAWLAVSTGTLEVGGATLRREMAVFEPGDGRIEVLASGETEFVVGSAEKHPHPLVLGTYSVHTSEAALALGLAGIRRVGAEMRRK